MKTIRNIIFAASAILLAASLNVSCSKEENVQANNEMAGITVSIDGELGALAQIDDTKSSLSNPITLKWIEEDKVYAFDGVKCLGALDVTLKEGKDYYALLSGELDAPAEGTAAITLVHATGFSATKGEAITGGNLSFDLSSQSGAVATAPFVAYATMEYKEGQTSIDKLVVNFTFATSIIRINCSGMEASMAFSYITINGMSNECVLEIDGDGVSVGTGAVGSISLNNSTTNAQGTRALYAGLARTASASNAKIEMRQDWKTYGGNIANITWEDRKAYNSICPVLPYVEIEADYDQDLSTPDTKLKWYRENLAISTSGKRVFNNTIHTNGDYFQWGAHKGYCGNESDADMGLLIYESFNHYYCVGIPPYGMICKSAGEGKTYWFNNSPNDTHEVITPYYKYKGSTYTSYYEKYNESDGKVTLEESDDVAHIILGGSWRMPTSKEFQALYNVTYWAYDATDRGYYVYTPNPSNDAGKVDDAGKGTYNKADALMFFPFSGCAGHLGVSLEGDSGYYLSSTVEETNSVKILYMNYFVADGYGLIRANGDNHRYQGCTVRSVSE